MHAPAGSPDLPQLVLALALTAARHTLRAALTLVVAEPTVRT